MDESIYYNMQGVSLFGSTVSNDLVNAMHGLGFYTGANEFLFDGANPVSSSILGIRYVFRRPEEYMSYDMNYVDTIEGVDVYQNDKALSLGFMVNDGLKDWTSNASNMFESINSFVELSTGVVGTFSQLYPDVTGSSNDITITHTGDFSEYYALSDITPGILSFSLKFNITDEQDDLYIIPNCNGITKIRIYVNGEEQNYERLQYQTYHVGHLSRGTEVEVEYYFSGGVPDNTSARLTVATLNADAYNQAYNRWAATQMKVGEFEDGYVKGHISPSEDGLMFTSIPYDSGWTAYVDGKKTDIQTVAGAFIALDLKAGDHVVEFKYFPRGLKTGIVFTFVGWMIMALLMNAESLKKRASGKKKIHADAESTQEHDSDTKAVSETQKEVHTSDGVKLQEAPDVEKALELASKILSDEQNNDI